MRVFDRQTNNHLSSNNEMIVNFWKANPERYIFSDEPPKDEPKIENVSSKSKK